MRLRLQQEKVHLRLRIVAVAEVLEEAQKNGLEMEKDRDKSSNCDSHVICVDVRCFL